MPHSLLTLKVRKIRPLLPTIQTRKSMLSFVIFPWTSTRLSWPTIPISTTTWILGHLPIDLRLHSPLASDLESLNHRNTSIPAQIPPPKDLCHLPPSSNQEKCVYSHNAQRDTHTILQRNRSKAPLFLADFSDKDTNERNGNSKVPSFTDSNDKKTENRDGEECFTLDYSLFDIVPTPPHSSMDTTSLGSDSKPLTSDPFDPLIPDNSSPLKRYHTPHTLQDRQSSQQAFDQGFLRHSGSVSIFPVVTPSTTFPPNNSMLKVSNGSIMHQAESMNAQVDETGVPDNDLAELEAWLLSDAVIITD